MKEYQDEWAIHNAVLSRDTGVVLRLLDELYGEKPDENLARCIQPANEREPQTGLTALQLATLISNQKMVQRLLAVGCDPNVADSKGQTPLMIALKHHESKQSHFNLLSILVADDRTDCNKTDIHGRSALLYAAKYGCKRAVSLLLGKTSEEARSDKDGLTALMIAAARNNIPIVKELKLKSDDNNLMHIKDSLGLSAILYSVIFGQMASAELLLKYGANPLDKDIFQRSSIHLAAARGQTIVLSLLIDHLRKLDNNSVENISEKDKYGKNPLQLAARNGNESCCRLLAPFFSEGERIEAAREAKLGCNHQISEFLLRSQQGSRTDEFLHASASPLRWLRGRSKNLTQDNVPKSNESLGAFRSHEPSQAIEPSAFRAKAALLIYQFLRSVGLSDTAEMLKNEFVSKKEEKDDDEEKYSNLHAAILQGNWATARKILKSSSSLLKQSTRSFIFQVYRLEFLELIAKGNPAAAFSCLNRRLKPIESELRAENVDVREDMSNLAYLLTCRSVSESPMFSDWNSNIAREHLGKVLTNLVTTTKQVEPQHDAKFLDQLFVEHQESPNFTSDLEVLLQENQSILPNIDPPDRSTVLTRSTRQRFRRLSEDADIRRLNLGYTLSGNRSRVKCVDIASSESTLVISGAVDGTIHLWNTSDAADKVVLSDAEEYSKIDPIFSEAFEKFGHDLEPVGIIEADEAVIWDISVSGDSSKFASTSGSGIVRIWSIPELLKGLKAWKDKMVRQDYIEPLNVGKSSASVGDRMLRSSWTEIEVGHSADVYSVALSNQGTPRLLTGSYDQTSKIVDIEQGKEILSLVGHTRTVSQAIFDYTSQLALTCSKDCTVRIWDARAGICVNKFSQSFGEFSSLALSADGFSLLTGSKDSTNRIWDVRKGEVLHKLRGHVNTNKHFIRCNFLCGESAVVSGSQDGKLNFWDHQSGDLIKTEIGHKSVLYEAAWSEEAGYLATCSDDHLVKLWSL